MAAASSPRTFTRIIQWVVGVAFAITGLSQFGEHAFKAVLLLACAALLIPPVAARIEKGGLTMSRWSKILVYVVGFVVMTNTAGQSAKEEMKIVRQNEVQHQEASSSVVTVTPPTENRDAAKKELTDFMALAKKSGLVDSYEFSDMATVVYVSSLWYTQTVTFKKDFLAKTAVLKDGATGHKHFEVRDAHSNEKVAEVTAFSQSLEVYK